MPDSPLSLFRRVLGDERGIALPFALGVTMVLSALAAGIFTYVTANQGSAKRVQADQRAYGLAETGLSYALSRLQNAADPYDATAVPSTTVSLTGGTTTYSGSLSGTTWTLTSNGTVTNPSGPAAANVVRTASVQAEITTSTTANLGPWEYLFIDQPSSCITLGNSVTLDLSIYVRGDLCLENTALLNGAKTHIDGSLYVNNSASVGTSGDPIDDFQASGSCYYSASQVPCGPSARVYADNLGTTPPSLSKPPVDLAYWYDNATLGPGDSCSALGDFDNDATLNVSLGSVDLTPASAYSCSKDTNGDGTPEAEITWAPGSPGTLTVGGTIYIDGNVTWSNLNLIQYDGLAVIYVSGQVKIKNRADLCGVPACDETWDPGDDLIVFVAGSLLSETSSNPTGGEIGNHVNFQGAMYIVNDFEMDNNTTIWGPVITRSTEIANSALLHAPPFPISWMEGLPADSATVTEVALVQGSYAG